MSPRQLVTGCSLFALLLACFAAFAQTVYTWKDAKGVTHYSDAPPPGSAAEARTMPVAPPPPTPAPAAASEPAMSGTPEAPLATATAESARQAREAAAARCTQARANLTALQGSAPVGPDKDGDGQPDATLTPEERAAQVEAMQAAIASSCSGG